MRVWLTCFVLLFGIAEISQWMQDFSLPLPIFILGGVFLAIASNYTKLANLPFHPDYEDPGMMDQIPENGRSQPQKVAAAQQPAVRSAAAPKKVPAAQQTVVSVDNKSSKRPISFEIQKPFNPGD